MAVGRLVRRHLDHRVLELPEAPSYESAPASRECAHEARRLDEARVPQAVVVAVGPDVLPLAGGEREDGAALREVLRRQELLREDRRAAPDRIEHALPDADALRVLSEDAHQRLQRELRRELRARDRAVAELRRPEAVGCGLELVPDQTWSKPAASGPARLDHLSTVDSSREVRCEGVRVQPRQVSHRAITDRVAIACTRRPTVGQRTRGDHHDRHEAATETDAFSSVCSPSRGGSPRFHTEYLFLFVHEQALRPEAQCRRAHRGCRGDLLASHGRHLGALAIAG